MKNSAFQYKTLKYKVSQNKNYKKFWSLNQNEREYLERSGYLVRATLFKIPTRKLRNYYNNQSHLLKELHHAYKNGKRYIVKELNATQLKELHENGISPQVLKFRVLPPQKH